MRPLDSSTTGVGAVGQSDTMPGAFALNEGSTMSRQGQWGVRLQAIRAKFARQVAASTVHTPQRVSSRQARRILSSYVAMAAGVDGVVAVRCAVRQGRWVVETITRGWDWDRDTQLDSIERALRQTRMRRAPTMEFYIVPKAALDDVPLWHEGWQVLYSRPEV